MSRTTAAIRQGVTRSRTWAAPQVERTGQFVQQTAAPRLSALLSSAARKIEPARPLRRRWTKGAGAAGLLAAAGAAAAVLRMRRMPAATQPAERAEDDNVREADGQHRVTDAETSQQDLSAAENSVT